MSFCMSLHTRDWLLDERPTGDAADDLEPEALELFMARQRVADDAGVHAKDEPVALQDHDRDPVAPDQLLRPLADQGHHRLEVEVGGGDVLLGSR